VERTSGAGAHEIRGLGARGEMLGLLTRG
jgi:hypothetical protein